MSARSSQERQPLVHRASVDQPAPPAQLHTSATTPHGKGTQERRLVLDPNALPDVDDVEPLHIIDIPILEAESPQNKVRHRIALASGVPPQQPPGTLRIFLGPTIVNARRIFQFLGDNVAVKYLDKNETTASEVKSKIQYKRSCEKKEGKKNPALSQARSYQEFDPDDAGHGLLALYSPCDLLSWISIRECEFANFIFPGLAGARCTSPDENWKWAVQNQLRLSRQSEDRLALVWFDFKEFTMSFGDKDIKLCDIIQLRSACQHAFIKRIMDGKALCTTETESLRQFLAFLMLDIVSVDLQRLERCVLLQPRNKAAVYLYPSALTYLKSFGEEDEGARAPRLTSMGKHLNAMEMRVRYFHFWQKLVEKSEFVQSFLGHLSVQTQATFGKNHQRDDVTQTIDFLQAKSSYLAVQARSQDKNTEGSFSLHAQLSQDTQTKNMSALTIIAAVFLPLQLTAGLLSMQYRVGELGLRFYDFAAVSCILFTIVGIFYYIGRWLMKLSFKLTELRLRMWDDEDSVYLYRFLSRPLYLHVLWMLVVASFLIGLLDSPRAGLKMLGISTAGIGGLFLLFCIIGCCSSVVNTVWKRKTEKMKKQKKPAKQTV